ncbi:murein hydrolase activator EnvC [Butyrivibrio sp. INlla16]|uniref:murein hydrolase activator EnvC family protein n=1 Tax=Butyrivibrio sp. INlla16 TaxID=1520807 RepID=UPI0008879771|nr:peptidoglycan DD-metalloendopeptidase family protein [Butyrivibrio sp. INlla16]SDB37948.1 Murein DD-endopeptidase MepM and murein hydrolase activator NlpD, contain LysM domain [Butyrivibrio sp. INlla16]
MISTTFGKRITGSVLVLCLLAGTVSFAGTPVRAAVTAESIKKKEGQIKDAKKERDSMKSSLTDLQSVKKSLEKEKSDLNSYITKLDANLDDIQKKIQDLGDKIEQKEKDIEETTAELEEDIRIQNEQYEAMKKRIRFMYERGDTLYFQLLLETGTFSDMLNKVEYIEELSAYDKGRLDEYIAQTELTTLTKEVLEEEKKTLDEAKAEVVIEEGNLQTLIAEKNTEVTKLSANIQDKEAAIAEYEKQIAEENATIAALEKAVEAEKAELAAQNARKYDGGMFTFPCPSYTRISDDYGMRMHPTLGIQKMHNGIDLAAASGSAILAAYDGKVVAAAYNSTMGNYVMISHGSGLYTIYMHASSLSVSTGAEVTKGQRIGSVGSTGRSTGPHLHFGVRLNGSYVSPWNYLK